MSKYRVLGPCALVRIAEPVKYKRHEVARGTVEAVGSLKSPLFPNAPDTAPDAEPVEFPELLQSSPMPVPGEIPPAMVQMAMRMFGAAPSAPVSVGEVVHFHAACAPRIEPTLLVVEFNQIFAVEAISE